MPVLLFILLSTGSASPENSLENSKATMVPATEVMSLYKFNGDLKIPYFSVSSFQKSGPQKAAGYLSQGTSLIPCVVIKNGKPLTTTRGTPYVGFEVMVEPSSYDGEDVDRLNQVAAQRLELKVKNHHCPATTKFVIDSRRLIHRSTAPFSLPPPNTAPKSAHVPPASSSTATGTLSAQAPKIAPIVQSPLDAIVHAFHASEQCEQHTSPAIHRRAGLKKAWTEFTKVNQTRWPKKEIRLARHLDFVVRTALYEGHLGRGCSAYGGCERNTIALSIRNRAKGQCIKRQGCAYPGDFEGVASSVSQYNIWDEYLTQISGLATCFLRPDLASVPKLARIQSMYRQSIGDIERILYGGNGDLLNVFEDNPLKKILKLRHYYHPPAMGKCFPNQERIEYISGAVAKSGKNHILLINQRIRVDAEKKSGYLFRDFELDAAEKADNITLPKNYPGFLMDKRKIALGKSSGCAPYGVSSGCDFKVNGRFRKPAFWLKDGEALKLKCSIKAAGKSCEEPIKVTQVAVGGKCDVDMQPVSGVY